MASQLAFDKHLFRQLTACRTLFGLSWHHMCSPWGDMIANTSVAK